MSWTPISVHTALNIPILMFKKLKWEFFKKNNLRWIDNVPIFNLIRKLGKLERVKSESWQRAPLWTSSPRLMRGLRKSSSGLLKRNSEKARTGESCIPTIPYLYISVVVCGYSSLIHCCFILQFHWGGVSCQRRAMYLDWQTYMDHRPSGWHHKLCTWVSFLSDVRKDAYNFLGSNNFW